MEPREDKEQLSNAEKFAKQLSDQYSTGGCASTTKKEDEEIRKANTTAYMDDDTKLAINRINI